MPIKSAKEKAIIFLKFLRDQAIRLNNSLGVSEKAGIVLIAMSVLLVALIFFPVLKEEIRYEFSAKKNTAPVESRQQAQVSGDSGKSDVMVPVDENFGIVIPKISANAKIIADVDSQNSAIYQRALTQGVAHAKGTAKPGEDGNIFLFAHSGANPLEANRYNAVFYLLSKLEAGDNIYLFYQGQKFAYLVKEKKIVAAEEANYMEADTKNSQLTLMTCWPPGTTLKRLIVIAEQK